MSLISFGAMSDYLLCLQCAVFDWLQVLVRVFTFNVLCLQARRLGWGGGGG